MSTALEMNAAASTSTVRQSLLPVSSTSSPPSGSPRPPRYTSTARKPATTTSRVPTTIGIVAPPGISDDDTQKWVDAVTEMHDSDAWKKTLTDQGWTDAFMTGDDFGSFLDEESGRVESVMSELGLA